MTSTSLGALDQPVTWALQEVGRLLLRARPLAGGADAWYVLVPETTQTIQAGGASVAVTVAIAFAGTEDVGATVTVNGPGAKDLELTVFVNVGGTSPSWAYLAALAKDEPLPQTLAVRLTTPASSLLSSTHTALTAAITTTDANDSLTLRLGRADLPTAATSASVSLTPLQITNAITKLLTYGLSLTGLTLPVGGSGLLTVQAPAADTGMPALPNPAVPSMTDVLATFTRPGGTAPIGTASWTVGVDQKDNSASGQASPTTVTWTADDRYDLAVLLVSKDPVAKNGLTNRTNVLTANASTLPRSVTAVLSSMPDIAYGGTSPDPSLAAPTLHYTANARLPKVDLITVSQAQTVNPLPPQGTPAPTSSAHVVAADVPREVVVSLGQWDPNHPDDTYVDLVLRDGSGNADVLGHLSLAAAESAVLPALLAANGEQQVRIEGSAGPRKADLLGLTAATVQTQPRPITATQTITTTSVHFLADTARRAEVTLLDDDGALTTVLADTLPTEVRLQAQLPDAVTLADETATWSAHGHWTAAAAIGSVTATKKPSPAAQALAKDALDLTATLIDLPKDVRVEATNDGTATVTELLWVADSRVTSVSADANTRFWSQANAPFSHVVGQLAPLPRGTAVGLRRSADGLDLRYGGSDPISTADVTVRSTKLSELGVGQFVANDKARVIVNDVPATTGDPQAVASAPRLTALLDSPPAGTVVHVEVPAALPPLGEVHVRVVDDRPSDTDGDTFPTPAGVRLVNRPRLGAGQADDLPGAPVGSLLVLTLPRLRSARYDGRNGQSLPTTYAICQSLAAGEKPLGVDLVLDAPQAVTLELAVDGDANHPGSTWVTGTAADVQRVALDGQLPDPGAPPSASTGTHLAVEVLPEASPVDLVVKRYDRNPAAQPAVDPSDTTSVAADRLARSSLAHVLVDLPARLEARLDAPYQRLDQANGFATFEPSQRRGSQVLASDAHILPTTNGTHVLTGWVGLQHGLDEDVPLWKDFCTDAQTRVEYVIRRTTSSTVVPGQPVMEREVHDVGTGPTGLRHQEQVDSVVLACVERLLGIEVSEQTTSAAVGSRPQQRFVARWNKEGWDLPFRTLHLENEAPTGDDIRGVLTHLDPTTELLLTPEAWSTENGRLASEARLRIGTVGVTAEGRWEHGFPHVVQPEKTPLLMGTQTRRPEGVTALMLELAIRGQLTLRKQRHWSDAEPGKYDETSSLFLQCPDGLDAKGWVLANRTASTQELVDFLQGAVASMPAPMVAALQGGVRIPHYSQPESQDTDNPWFMRPGETASPHSAAVALERLSNVELQGRRLCDDDLREWPVFVADDGVGAQAGVSSSSLNLNLINPSGAATFNVVAMEIDDWEDSPPLAQSDALALRLDNGLPQALSFDSTTTVVAAPGKRPTSDSVIRLSSTGSTALTNGPSLGHATLTLNTLDTSANPWAPVLRHVDADIADLPGFVRLQNESAVDISRFPDGSSSNLDTPDWDSKGAYGEDESSTRRTRAWASGPVAATIRMSSPDFRRSSSTKPSPWKAPRFDLKLLDIQITATPSGPLDLTMAPLTLMTATRGPAGEEADAGLALCAACGSLVLDGSIKTDARYWMGYQSDALPPVVSNDSDSAVLTLSSFSGKLTLQARDFDYVDAIAIVVASFAAVASSGIFAAFAIFVAELAFLEFLMHMSPVRVDDLCQGSWYLTVKPSARKKLSVLSPFVDGWGHGEWPYEWDLNASIFVVLAAVLAGAGYFI